MQKNNGKYLNKKARLPLSVYLSYLLALTLVLGGVTSAKYTSSASGTATARVAKFDVDVVAVEGSWPNPAAVRYGEVGSHSYVSDPVDCKFRVVNNSEVAITYQVVVEFEDVLPDKATIKFTDPAKITVEMNSKKNTSSKTYSLAAGAESDAFTVNVASAALDNSTSFITQMRVYVIASQAD